VGVAIRARDDLDLGGCVALLRAVHEHDAYPLWWPTDPLEWVSDAGCRGSWVADAAGTVVGHVQLRRAEGTPVSVWAGGTGRAAEQLGVVARMFVDPHHRRTGIGRALLEQAVEEAKRRDLGPVLDVLVRNRDACQMYEACGWRKVGEFSWEFDSGKEPAYAYALL
jgi:GNAT superfamily N-acetyltransferase